MTNIGQRESYAPNKIVIEYEGLVVLFIYKVIRPDFAAQHSMTSSGHTFITNNTKLLIG